MADAVVSKVAKQYKLTIIENDEPDEVHLLPFRQVTANMGPHIGKILRLENFARLRIDANGAAVEVEPYAGPKPVADIDLGVFAAAKKDAE